MVSKIQKIITWVFMAKLKMADIKVGGVYKMKNDNLQNWGITKGDPVEVVYINGHNINVVPAGNKGGQQMGVTVSQLDFYLQSKKSIEEDIAEAEGRVKTGQAKLAWMAQTKNEEFDEDEFKVWHTLQILKDSGTTEEAKAKAIAALIKQR